MGATVTSVDSPACDFAEVNALLEEDKGATVTSIDSPACPFVEILGDTDNTTIVSEIFDNIKNGKFFRIIIVQSIFVGISNSWYPIVWKVEYNQKIYIYIFLPSTTLGGEPLNSEVTPKIVELGD